MVFKTRLWDWLNKGMNRLNHEQINNGVNIYQREYNVFRILPRTEPIDLFWNIIVYLLYMRHTI